MIRWFKHAFQLDRYQWRDGCWHTIQPPTHTVAIPGAVLTTKRLLTGAEAEGIKRRWLEQRARAVGVIDTHCQRCGKDQDHCEITALGQAERRYLITHPCACASPPPRPNGGAGPSTAWSTRGQRPAANRPAPPRPMTLIPSTPPPDPGRVTRR